MTATKAAPKTTKAPTAQAAPATTAKSPEALKAARDARERAASQDVFTYVGKVAEGTKKLAPQAQVIVNAIQAAGKGGITREKLVAGLKGVLVTRQPESRILSYYQSTIVDLGHVSLTKAAVSETPATAAAAAPATK